MKFFNYLIVIVLLCGAIFWKINSNETKMNNYFQEHQCTNVVLHRSEYKAVCKENVILLRDFFFLDLDTITKILYKDIASAQKLGRVIILHNNHVELQEAEPRVYFGSEEEAIGFQEAISAKLK